MLVQTYLEQHSFADLAREHGVYASFSKSGHKWSLNYDMLEAKDDDPLAQECRGLILSCWNGGSFLSQAKEINGKLSYDHLCPGKTRVIARPINRFFNYGQGAAADIDWNASNLSILEKMDGTLSIVYWDPFTDRWCVATRAVSEADLLMDNGLHTFRTLFEKALHDTIASSDYAGLSFEDYTAMLDKEITYCYELTTPLNRIVVSYPDYRITLIAARINIYRVLSHGDHAHISQELEIEKLPSYGVPVVRSYQRMSVQELVDWVGTLNPMENEGVVVRVPVGQGKFNRIKVKNPSYLLYSKARDALGHSERNCLEIILLGKEDDLIPYLPEEIVQNLLKIKVRLQDLIKKYDAAYQGAQEAISNSPSKKAFALLITSNKELWSAPFFQRYDGKCIDMRSFIEKNKANGAFSDSFLDKLLSLFK
jgi:hypothetical protein